MDEAGHETGPAACFEPAESEPHAGGEVDEDEHKTSPAASRMPAESERPAWREVDEANVFSQTPVSAGIAGGKRLMNRAKASVCGLVANFDSVVEFKLLSPLLWDKGTLEAKQRVRGERRNSRSMVRASRTVFRCSGIRALQARGSTGGNTPHPNLAGRAARCIGQPFRRHVPWDANSLLHPSPEGEGLKCAPFGCRIN